MIFCKHPLSHSDIFHAGFFSLAIVLNSGLSNELTCSHHGGATYDALFQWLHVCQLWQLGCIGRQTGSRDDGGQFLQARAIVDIVAKQQSDLQNQCHVEAYHERGTDGYPQEFYNGADRRNKHWCMEQRAAQ